MTLASRSDREPSFWSAAVSRKRSVLRASRVSRRSFFYLEAAHLLIGEPGTDGPFDLVSRRLRDAPPSCPSRAPPSIMPDMPSPFMSGCSCAVTESVRKGVSCSDCRNSLQGVAG